LKVTSHLGILKSYPLFQGRKSSKYLSWR